MTPDAARWVRQAALWVFLAIGLKKFIGLWLYGATALPFSPTLLLRGLASLGGASAGAADARLAWALAAYLVAFALFAAAGLRRFQAPRGHRAALTAAQIGLALLVDEKLLVLVAAESALLLPRRPALAWLGAQMGLTAALHIFLALQGSAPQLLCAFSGPELPVLWPPAPAFSEAAQALAATLGPQALAFGFGALGAAEQRRRMQLAAAHAQLQATQQLLAATARATERARVARELHDTIGHHLMALKLHLDLALRRAGPGAPLPSVQAAQALTQDLLATVRHRVRHEQQGDGTPTGETP